MAQERLTVLEPTTSSNLEAHRAIIKQLYIDQCMPLSNVMEVMATQYNLNASMSMYKKKIRRWKMFKPGSGSLDSPPAITVSRKYQFIGMTMQWKSPRGKGKVVRSAPSYTLRNITSPMIFRMQEDMYHAIRAHLSERIAPRLQISGTLYPLSWKNVPLSKRKGLGNYEQLQNFASAVGNAQELFGRGQVPLAMASLSQACQQVESVVRENHFSLTLAVMDLMVLLWKSNMTECLIVLLRQMYSMASICNDSTHPLTLWTKRILYFSHDLDQFFEPLIQLSAKVFLEVLGPEDPYTQNVRATHNRALYELKRHKKMPLNDLNKVIDEEIGELSALEKLSGMKSIIGGNYAKMMALSGEFERGERYFMSTILRGLDINKITGENLLRNDLPLPLYLDHIAYLGHALGCQGKYEEATRVFVQVIPLLKEVVGPDSPDFLVILGFFAEVLQNQNLDDQAKAVYTALEEGLLPYMLKGE